MNKKLVAAIVACLAFWTLLIWAAGAFAQDASPPSAPVATPSPAADPVPSMPSTIWLEVNQADLTLISQALGQMQYGAVAPLVLKLNAQLAAQAKIVENKDADKPKKGKK